ncbi:MAG: FtsX-like permease family protein [Nocardioides sp.]|jgi:putative ABC transport system permease protein
MSELLGTIARGVRSRALLSAGSVLLVALAIASAIIGPVFQVAATKSYVVSRINSAPPQSTGLARTYAPLPSFAGGRDQATKSIAAYSAEQDRGPFGEIRLTWTSARVVGGLVETDIKMPGESVLLAKEGACDHLIIDQGKCPSAPGEAIVLRGDADHTKVALGDRIDMGPDLPGLSIVGTYLVDPAEEAYWYDLGRLSSYPRRIQEDGPDRPYRPAPYIVDPTQFDAIAPTMWRVLFDRSIEIPPDWTEKQIADAKAMGTALKGLDETSGNGRITADPVSALAELVAEARAQESTSRASIAPAVLSLVLVALALLLRLLLAATELRTPELALASLRGVSARKLWGLGLAEPLALLVIGLPLGLLSGVLLSRGLISAWLVPGLPMPWPSLLIVTVGAVLLAAFAVSVAAVGTVLSGSLSAQLTGVRRPAATKRYAVIAELVLVAIAVAVLASKLSVKEPGDPDVTDMILPIVLAAVAGLGMTRLVSLLARWRSRRAGRTLAGFVATRALGRRAEGTLVILPLTAAIAVGVFAIGVYDAAAQWRHSVAVTASPGAVLWKAPGTMPQAMVDSREVDPEGEHVVALARLAIPGARYSVVDAPRMAAVLEWPASWTPGTSLAEVESLITSQGAPIRFSGDRLGISYDNLITHDRDLYLTVHVYTAAGGEENFYLGPIKPGEGTVSVKKPYCRGGCTIGYLNLAGPASLQNQMKGSLVVHDFLADGEVIQGATSPEAVWVQSGGIGEFIDDGDVEDADDGLLMTVDTGASAGMLRMVPGGVALERPVVVGVDSADRITPMETGGLGTQMSGTVLPVDPRLTAYGMPFLGPDGILIDYRQLASDRLIYNDTFEAYLATNAATPTAVRDALLQRGYVVEMTISDEEALLSQGAYALALRLYAVVAIMVLVMALAGLIVSTAVQFPARRRDAAALRVVGVPRRGVMSAVARELSAVLVSAAVAGIAAGALAQYVVVRTVRLGYVESILTPPLVARVDWWWIGLLVLLAVTAFGVFAGVTGLLTVRGARGSTLRESAR